MEISALLTYIHKNRKSDEKNEKTHFYLREEIKRI